MRFQVFLVLLYDELAIGCGGCTDCGDWVVVNVVQETCDAEGAAVVVDEERGATVLCPEEGPGCFCPT